MDLNYEAKLLFLKVFQTFFEFTIVFLGEIFYNYNNKTELFGDIYQKSKEETAMVQLIVGKKGKGKTKQLLDKVNGAIKAAEGNIVYLDKSSKHMYELNNKVRLIDVSGYPIKNADEFIGFVCGIVSQDHDLQEMYLDSFLKNAKLEGKDITDALHQLKEISEAYKINFVLSVSMDKEEIPAEFQDDIIIAL